MKKRLLLFFILLSTIAYSQKNGCPKKDQKNYACGHIKEDILKNLPDLDYTLVTRINVQLTTTLKKKKRQIKAEKVLALVNKVLNDNDFWKALRYYDKYQFAKWSEKFNNPWQEVTGEQIINCMINGSPNLAQRPANIDLKIGLKLYGWPFKKPFEKAIGADGGNGLILNKKWFFRKESIVEIGSNWAHEIAHSKGFRHCKSCHAERDYSVPYVINRIFKEVAKKYN